MKKLFIAALMVVIIGSTAIAAAPVPVTTKVLNHFSATFAGATNVQWKTSATFVKATFTRDNQQWEAFYDVDGDLYGTSRVIGAKELPARATECFAKKYAAYTIKEVIEFDHAKDGLGYYVSLINEDTKLIMQVDINGNVSLFKKAKA